MKQLRILAAALSVAASLSFAQAKAQVQSDGLHVNSYITEVQGKPWRYERTLEAYTEGDYVIKQVDKHADVDFVLVLDNSGSMNDPLTKNDNKSKIESLKEAACAFVDLVHNDAVKYNANHRISIIQFNYNSYPQKINGTDIGSSNNVSNYINPDSEYYLSDVEPYGNEPEQPDAGSSSYRVKTRVRKLFTGTVSDTDVNSLKTNIKEIVVGGNTAIDYGMKLARLLLARDARNSDPSVSKVVIVFTDGAPTHNGRLNYNVYEGGYGVADNALEESNAIKNTGAKVYCINYNNSATNKNYHMVFMEALSSNYPNSNRFYLKVTSPTDQTTQTISNYNLSNSKVGAKNTDGKQYFIDATSDLSQLKSAFVSIGTEEVYRDTRFPLSSAAVLYDNLDSGFELASNAGSSYAVRFSTPVRINSSTFEFNSEQEISSMAGQISVTMTQDNKVQVTGFDFQQYYVGTKGNESMTVRNNGYKLIVHYPIQVKPSNRGGMGLQVNTAASGMYKSSADVSNPQNMVGSLPLNTVDGPNIVIVKKGLLKGESSVFRVYRLDSSGNRMANPITLVATNNTSADGADAIVSQKFARPGRYLVEETTWDWTYNTSTIQSSYTKDDSQTVISGNTITRNLNSLTQDTTGSLVGTQFIFSTSPKSQTPSHAEHLKKESFQ